MRRKNVPSILLETKEDRKRRLSSSMDMRTRVVPNKKKKSRAKQKQEDRKEVDV